MATFQRRRHLFWLCLIVLVAGILRFYQLGQNPPELTWDEAAWGYNAYALLTTGKDEFGRVLPLNYLESFGDFKPPVYAYLTILPVALFGLSEFSTRFVSAFFGVLTVLVTYFLTKRLFPQSEKKEIYALFSALFLAVSPWHINLSRAAFEANVSTFFIVSGVWLFLYGLQKNAWLFLLSAVSFTLSLYTFNTARIVSPLLVLALFFLFFSKLRKKIPQVLAAGALGFALLLPSLPFLFSDQAQLRFKEVNIFSNPEIVVQANQQIKNADNVWWAKVLSNRRVFYAREYVKHYLDNLNPSFLFIKGDGNPKFSTQQVGQLYLWDLPFLLIGGLLLFRKREGLWYLLPLWFLIGIIPAATARETPHALRIETVLPIPQIIVAYGFVQIVNLKSILFFRKLKASVLTVIFLFFLAINVLYYLHFYYAHYPRIYSGEWLYGYKDAIAFTENNKAEYDKIYFTTDLGRPYAYVLFYTQTDPHIFRTNAIISRDIFGFVDVKRFDKYFFVKDLPKDNQGENALYINTPGKVPSNATIIETFRLRSGDPSLVGYIL